jgi:protein tyrosine/serine phosphatase
MCKLISKPIKAALKGVKDKYGSVNAMLEKELGIDASDRAKLKQMYTN